MHTHFSAVKRNNSNKPVQGVGNQRKLNVLSAERPSRKKRLKGFPRKSNANNFSAMLYNNIGHMWRGCFNKPTKRLNATVGKK